MTTTPRQELTIEFIEQLQARALDLRFNPPPHKWTNSEIVQMIFGGVNVDEAGNGSHPVERPGGEA